MNACACGYRTKLWWRWHQHIKRFGGYERPSGMTVIGNHWKTK